MTGQILRHKLTRDAMQPARPHGPLHGLLWMSFLLLIAVLLAPGPVMPAANAAEQMATNDDGRVTLNFRDMDIEGLIQAVSRVTGRNFVVDPRVKAKVTVISERPMAAEEFYETFLSILQVHGFAAVESGNLVKVIPDVDARAIDQPVNPGEAISGSDEMVTAVVRLRFIPADPMLTVLRQIMPQQAALSVSPDSNALVITDRAGNIERIKRILDEVDQPRARDVQVIPLKHAAAKGVVETLEAFFGASGAATAPAGEAGGSTGIEVPTFAADERTNNVLIGGNRIDRARMHAVILDLDTPTAPPGDTQVFRLKYARAENLIEVLRGVENLGAGGSGGNEGQTAPGETFRISADQSLNALVVTAAPNRMAAIQSVIEQLDLRRSQVLVEAIIAEVSEDLSQRLGAQILAGGTEGTVPLGISTFNGLLAEVAQSAGSATGANALALGLASSIGDGGNFGVGRFGEGGTDFALLISALSANAGNNILSTPSLLTLDNEEASIVVGQNIPLVTGSYAQTGSATSPDNPFQTISREDIGIKLKVKPSISPDGTVRMTIEQEVSSIDTTTQSAAGLITNKRNVSTSVQVDDGDVVVLGGLIDDSSKNNQQKVPGLGDIPFVGNLFRYRETQATKRNLMVFIRPVIINARRELAQYSDHQYDRIRSAQREAWSPDSLGKAEDWHVLPPRQAFLTNAPVPLPDNIERLMQLDRLQENGGGGGRDFR